MLDTAGLLKPLLLILLYKLLLLRKSCALNLALI